MATYWNNYEIAVGLDQTPPLANFESIFSHPLKGKRVPLGAVTEFALDGTQRTDGEQLVTLSTPITLFSELDAYVTLVFGDWGTENADVTLRCKNRDNSYTYYNATAYLPLEEQVVGATRM